MEDVADSLKRLEEKGIILVDKEPRRGFEDRLIAFLHPQSTLGVLTELCAVAKISARENCKGARINRSFRRKEVA
ncbi:MAG: hypothetical protein ONB05_10405 [candidate division KSB1 bacterium]|nr:hypothetical protein [candidate division KSB1 bacterium]